MAVAGKLSGSKILAVVAGPNTQMIGRKLSHYEVVESLGAGGMGEVYRARDSRLGRDVAIKVLPPDRTLDETSRRRFQREAMAASSLNHPNIITIYEINSEGDTDFIVMEHVRGATLSSRIKRGPLPIDEAVGYASQIAEALSKAHAAGIVHRDLKPGNVMITDDGLVKVLDFGLAKFDTSSVNTQGSSGEHQLDLTLSLPGAVTGTIAYMSPEQARGDRVDARSDVFSFAIMFFEMLAGQLPFAGPNAIAILHNIHFNPPRDLRELRSDVPPPLAGLLWRMLEKPPEKRPTMAEVASVLRAGARAAGAVTWRSGDGAGDGAGDRAMDALSASAWGQAAPVRSGRRWVWLGVGAVLLVGMLGAGGYFVKKRASAKSAAATEVTAAEPAEGDAFALYKKGREELDHFDRPGATDRAIKTLERAVELDPQSGASFAALAQAYALKNDQNADPQWLKLTAQNARRALELNPDLASAHISLGISERLAKHSEQAITQFQTAANLDPESGAPYREFGILYDSAGKREQARVALNRAVQLDPNDWRAYMELAFNEFQGADYKQAAANWEHALKLEPDNLDALNSLGGVYHMLGRDDDGAAALQQALAIKPDSDTFTNLGTIRFYQGRYIDAVTPFEKAVALRANDYYRWGNLGDAYRWAPGLSGKAGPAYEQAIQLGREEIAKAPAQSDLRANVALYLAKRGDKAGALIELALLERANNKYPSVLYTMGVAYEVCHQRGKALELLEAAVKAGQSVADLKSEPELTALRADPQYHLRILNASAGKP